MDTTQVVALLVAERDRLTKAIEALQGTSTAKRRGRPPKNPLAAGAAAALVSASAAPAPVGPKKRKQSAASKKSQSEKMKAYWAAKKKAEK